MINFSKLKMITFNMVGPIINDNQSSLKLLSTILAKYNINDKLLNYYNGININNHINYLIEQNYNNQDLQQKNNVKKIVYDEYITKLQQKYLDEDIVYIENKTMDIIHNLRCNDIKVTLTTNIPKNITSGIIKNLELHNVINDYVCCDEVKIGKPTSEMLEILFENNDVKPNETMKISNTIVDILEGSNAKVLYNMILDDKHTDNFIKYHPTHIINNIDELNINKNKRDIFATKIISNIKPLWYI